jgi:hypothetical protein
MTSWNWSGSGLSTNVGNMEHHSELKFFHPQGFAMWSRALTTNGRLSLIRREKEPWHHASHCHQEWEVPCWSEKTQYSERGYFPWDVLSLEIHEYNIIILSYTQTLVAPPAEVAKSWPYMYSHKTQGIHCCCWFLIHAYGQILKGRSHIF